MGGCRILLPHDLLKEAAAVVGNGDSQSAILEGEDWTKWTLEGPDPGSDSFWSREVEGDDPLLLLRVGNDSLRPV